MDIDAVCRGLAPKDPRNKALRRLCKLVGSLQTQAPLSTRLDSLEALSAWLRASGKLPPAPEGQPVESESGWIRRFQLLIRLLEFAADTRAAFRAWLGSLVADCTAVGFLCGTGLPARPHFFAEATDRLLRKVLPAPFEGNGLGDIVERLFPSERDLAFLPEVPAPLWERFVRLLSEPDSRKPNPWAPLWHSVGEAAQLIATRVAALGLAEDIRGLSGEASVRDSPFLRLAPAFLRLVEADESGEPATLQAAAEGALRAVADARAAFATVRRALEAHGVSVDLVYRLELGGLQLSRLSVLTRLLIPATLGERVQLSVDLLFSLSRASWTARRILPLIQSSAHLLARKIVERAGQTGEHYITATRAEWFAMLGSGGGGGVLTAGTTVLKFWLIGLKLPLLMEGLLASFNYAGSFLGMQLLGFTLATKQPSMTAAALAGALKEGAADVESLTALIARTVRSQGAAALGNLGFVIPAALLADWAVRWRWGRHVLDTEAAHHALTSLNPFSSGTMVFATLTGVLLWMSSMCGGWVENWAVFRRLPEAIAQHRIRRWLGGRLLGWVARVFARNVSAFASNVSLGFLLGMLPALSRALGLSIEVRHVTLSMGGVALAAGHYGWAVWMMPAIYVALLGVLLIGALNFSVSFALALAVAIRASVAGPRPKLGLWRALGNRLRANPREFFLPPRASPATEGALDVNTAGTDG
jgi:site-specific recombinase